MAGDDIDQLQDGTTAGKKTAYLQKWEDFLGKSEALSRREEFSDITLHLAELELTPDIVMEDDMAGITQLLKAIESELELPHSSAYLLSQYVKQHKRDLLKGIGTKPAYSVRELLECCNLAAQVQKLKPCHHRYCGNFSDSEARVTPGASKGTRLPAKALALVPYTPDSNKSSKAVVDRQPATAAKSTSKGSGKRLALTGKGPWSEERKALDMFLTEEMTLKGWLPGDQVWGEFVQVSKPMLALSRFKMLFNKHTHTAYP